VQAPLPPLTPGPPAPPDTHNLQPGEYTKAQLEASAAAKESFFQRQMMVGG